MAQPTVARRTTRQQTLVRELVAELDTLTSAQEIHHLLPQDKHAELWFQMRCRSFDHLKSAPYL